MTISSISITGADPQDFYADSNCGSSVAENASCTIYVTFTPTANGTRTATLQVTDDASNSPQTASLKGGPFAYFNPPSLTFASQQVGTTSAAQNIHLVSQGFDGEGSPLVVSSVSISGANAGDFSQTNACNSFGCALQVTFTPTASGTRTV